jgi:hypothetical protein
MREMGGRTWTVVSAGLVGPCSGVNAETGTRTLNRFLLATKDSEITFSTEGREMGAPWMCQAFGPDAAPLLVPPWADGRFFRETFYFPCIVFVPFRSFCVAYPQIPPRSFPSEQTQSRG